MAFLPLQGWTVTDVNNLGFSAQGIQYASSGAAVVMTVGVGGVGADPVRVTTNGVSVTTPVAGSAVESPAYTGGYFLVRRTQLVEGTNTTRWMRSADGAAWEELTTAQLPTFYDVLADGPDGAVLYSYSSELPSITCRHTRDGVAYTTFSVPLPGNTSLGRVGKYFESATRRILMTRNGLWTGPLGGSSVTLVADSASGFEYQGDGYVGGVGVYSPEAGKYYYAYSTTTIPFMRILESVDGSTWTPIAFPSVANSYEVARPVDMLATAFGLLITISENLYGLYTRETYLWRPDVNYIAAVITYPRLLTPDLQVTLLPGVPGYSADCLIPVAGGVLMCRMLWDGRPLGLLPDPPPGDSVFLQFFGEPGPPPAFWTGFSLSYEIP